MSTQSNKPANPPANPLSIRDFFGRDTVKQKFAEMLGKRSTSFITSVLQIVASNDLLSKAEPTSIYQSAAVAATLDLPLNNSLGYAYIVPYNSKQKDGTYKVLAQFQIGAKGFKQLALRTGQFKRINETDVREGEIKFHDRLSGDMEFEWIQDEEIRNQLPIIGYVSYFKLTNGFEKIKYMTVDELIKHGKRFSQTYKKDYGLWKDDFDSMSRKTVTKLNLSKDAPLSIEMQTAMNADQAVIKDAETGEVEYPDNEEVIEDAEVVSEQKENERILKFIAEAKTKKELQEAEPFVQDGPVKEAFDAKMKEVK